MKKQKQIQSIPMVSVIIPVYNVEEYLEECLESVLHQTLVNIEIICVNDGSTDQSLNILKNYEKKDSRVVVLTGSNKGYGHAINCGIAAAKGEYIGIVESDDYIMPDMYETLYNVAKENGNLDIVKSDAIRFTRNGEDEDCSRIPVCDKKLYNREIIIAEEPECFNAYMINPTGIYRRTLFVQNNIKLNESKGAAYQDNGLWFQLFSSAETIMFLDKAFYMYRMDRVESSTNCTTFENALCIFGEWRYIYGILNQYDAEKRRRCLPIFILRFYGSCFYHFTRVLEEYKFLFIKRFSEELRFINEQGDLCVDLLKPYQCDDLFIILEEPSLFYYNWCKKNVHHIFDEKTKSYIYNLKNRITEKNIIQKSNRGDNIKISVIVPVYNSEKTIQRCLRSILNQTLKEIEIICVDDGSEDRSLSILFLYAKQDERIMACYQDNMGAGAARNMALKLASGEYIAFMDSDDEYPNEKVLEELYRNAVENDVKICGGNTLICENGNCSTSADISFEKDGIVKYEDWQKAYGYSQFIYKRSLLIDEGIFFPQYRRFQDPPFFIRAMVAAKEFYAMNLIVYQYNFQPGHVNWNVDKICDLVGGITECISISKKSNLQKLHVELVMLLEKSYSDRILLYGNEDGTLVRQLAIAEKEIDSSIIEENLAIEKGTFQLQVLNKLIQKIKNKSPKGYIGPNAFRKYMDLKNECCCIKTQILLTQNSISYRLGVFFSGGKKKAYATGSLVEYSKLDKLGSSYELSELENDRNELNSMLHSIRSSKAMTRGLSLTSIFHKKYS